MSTYQQSSHPGPLDPSQPNRRRPRRDPLAPPPDYFRRRVVLIAVVGALIAPVALALRGDGAGVSSSPAPGAAALTQIDAAQSTEASTDTAIDTSTDTVTGDPSGDDASINAASDGAPPDTPPPTAASRTCASIYVVQSGDSWWALGERAGVSPGLIAGSNGVTTQKALIPGQELCVPVGVVIPPPSGVSGQSSSNQSSGSQSSTAPRCGLTYVVQAGDSWYGIAERAGVKAGPLASVNGKTLSSPLKVGDTICLPEGARRPAPTTTTTRPPSSSSSSSSSQSGSTVASYDMRLVPYEPSRLYSRDDIERIIRSVWPDHLYDDALFVVQRESRFNPGSRSRCCIGLFQLNWRSHQRWLATHGVTDPTQLLDPEVNARMALVAWERSGSWRPWCTSSWCPPS